MTLSTHLLRAAVAALAIGLAGISVGRAAAKNHDCQAFRLRADASLAQHDRAPGPSPRLPD